MTLGPKYLAGLFDGEGTVCIGRRYGKSNKGFVLQIGITNTYEPVIRAVSQQFGGHIHVVERKSIRHRRCFQWYACNAQAFRFLAYVRSHLIIKRAQAELAYEWDKHRITRQGIRRPDVDEKRAKMLAIREQIMALNRGQTICQA
jgi:hypothetical protein